MMDEREYVISSYLGRNSAVERLRVSVDMMVPVVQVNVKILMTDLFIRLSYWLREV